MFRMKLVGPGPAAASTPTAVSIQAVAQDAIPVHGLSAVLDRLPSSRGR